MSDDEAIRQFLAACLWPGAVAFDVGANVGQSAEAFVGLGATVVAFEPSPFAVQAIRARKLAGVSVVQAAVSDRAGSAVFHLDRREGLHGLASSLLRLEDLPEKVIERITVRTIRLDDFVAGSGVVPDFIKIDVEGCEPQVVAGALQTIHGQLPPMMLEFWRSHWDRYEPMFRTLDPAYHLTDAATGTSILATPGKPGLDGMTNILCHPRHPAASASLLRRLEAVRRPLAAGGPPPGG
jgi:FkbM family methyltransferase